MGFGQFGAQQPHMQHGQHGQHAQQQQLQLHNININAHGHQIVEPLQSPYFLLFSMMVGFLGVFWGLLFVGQGKLFNFPSTLMLIGLTVACALAIRMTFAPVAGAGAVPAAGVPGAAAGVVAMDAAAALQHQILNGNGGGAAGLVAAVALHDHAQ